VIEVACVSVSACTQGSEFWAAIIERVKYQVCPCTGSLLVLKINYICENPSS